MKVVAVYNIKGGVGKTATAVNLAYLAACDGLRVLLWDLDPQAAATFYLRVKPKVKGGGKRLVRGKARLDEAIRGSDYPNLDLLPAALSYRHMDLVLDEQNRPTRQLRKLLKPLADDYDIVLLDCPPGISLVSENVFHAADALLVPLIPTTLSLRTLELLYNLRKRVGFDQLRMMPFFSMVDARKSMHRDIMERVPRELPIFLQTSIPSATEVERMGLQRGPVGTFAPDSRGAIAYRALWQELRKALDPV